MDMLCIAAAHVPIGYVAVAGRALGATDIARMTGGSEDEVQTLLDELSLNGVFSRDRHGRIFSRRMTMDAKKAAIARKNGKFGGNPSLRKHTGNPTLDNPMDKGEVKPQEPRASIPEEYPISPKGEGLGLFEKKELPRIDEEREAFDAWNNLAKRCNLPEARSLDDARRRAIKARLKDGGLPAWQEALSGVEKSAFCLGQRPGSDGRVFKADLGFVCQAKSFPRLREGTYGCDAKAIAQAGPSIPPDHHARWRRSMRALKANEYWNSIDDGPKPGNPGCKVPIEILHEFGIQSNEGANR